MFPVRTRHSVRMRVKVTLYVNRGIEMSFVPLGFSGGGARGT